MVWVFGRFNFWYFLGVVGVVRCLPGLIGFEAGVGGLFCWFGWCCFVVCLVVFWVFVGYGDVWVLVDGGLV